MIEETFSKISSRKAQLSQSGLRTGHVKSLWDIPKFDLPISPRTRTKKDYKGSYRPWRSIVIELKTVD